MRATRRPHDGRAGEQPDVPIETPERLNDRLVAAQDAVDHQADALFALTGDDDFLESGSRRIAKGRADGSTGRNRRAREWHYGRCSATLGPRESSTFSVTADMGTMNWS